MYPITYIFDNLKFRVTNHFIPEKYFELFYNIIFSTDSLELKIRVKEVQIPF